MVTNDLSAVPEVQEKWTTAHTIVVLDGAGSGGGDGEVRVLMVAGEDGEGWGLPRYVVRERRSPERALEIVADVRERLGVESVVLRGRDMREDEERREASGVVVLERREHGEGSDSGISTVRWVGRAELNVLLPRDGADGDLVRRVLGSLGSGTIGSEGPPFSKLGWFAEAAAWMVERLEAVGRPATGAVEQFRNWCISAVLRAPTADGYVYLKAASAYFGSEARLTSALAERFPAALPRVLAADTERSWLLLEDVGEAIRRQGAAMDVAEWEEALLKMGEMQRSCVGQTDWLVKIGCADRRLARLREHVPALLAAPLTRDETEAGVLERLTRRIPELQDACDALAACGIPETLIHGDLHPGNVAVRDGRLAIFDWTDAAVGHPFVDLLTFLPTRPRLGILDPRAMADRLRDAYLEGWSGVASVHERRRAVELVRTVGRLHHAQSYVQLLGSVAPDERPHFHGAIGSWLTQIDSPEGESRDIFA